MALNLCQFMGNLGADPELKLLPSGESVVNFSIACTDRWKDKNTQEVKELTEWVRCSAFGNRAEVIAEYFKKGSAIMVVGKLRTRTWDKDGEKRYATDILVNEFHFCGSKQDKDTEQFKHQANDYLPPMPNFDNDIPF